MNMNSKTLLAAAGIAAVAFSPAYAIEGAIATKPGAFIGASAGVPPPGIYMFNQVFTYQANLVGPGAPGGFKAGVHANVDVQGFLFVPGWTFLGATYDALIVQPFVDLSLGSPINLQASGAFNTYIVPVELSWKLGNFGIKTGLGIYLPDGCTTGTFKLGCEANPYTVYQPELILSYLGNGWNLSAALYEEFATANRATQYTTGDIFHADFTATKTIGKWTIGPVAYYVAQVTDDSCPASCIATGDSVLLHKQRFSEWAAGALVGYDFGAASLSVWATEEFGAKASNHFAAPGADPSAVAEGATVFATLSYRLWAPEAPVQPAMYHK
jgi:hypothetical protein